MASRKRQPSPSPQALGWKCERFSFETGESWTHERGAKLEIEHRSDAGESMRARLNEGEWFERSTFGEVLEHATALARKAAR